MDWARKAQMEMKILENGKLGDFQNKYMFHITCNTIKVDERIANNNNDYQGCKRQHIRFK
jgi:CDP-diacylglycerol pyrophosphatase